MISSKSKAESAQRRNREAGAALVEAIIGLLLFTIVSLSAGQLLRMHVDPLLVAERQRKAAKQAESLLNEISSQSGASLVDGGSFELNKEGNPVVDRSSEVKLSCSTSYCDQIVALPETTGTERQLMRFDWQVRFPQGSTAIYTRAWRINTLDAGRRLRRITVLIFPSGETQPLITQTTNVVLR